MSSLRLRVDAVLRSDASLRLPVWQLWSMVVGFGVVYGAAMGSFGGVTGERFWQLVFSAIKVPLLLFGTVIVSVPSFFVLNTVMGLREDFMRALRAVILSQTALTVLLAALAPYTLLWYRSSGNYKQAILFNALMFGVASLSAQWLLRRQYAPLIEKDSRHRVMLRVWLVIYTLVGIQMAWVLRPFIGHPDLPSRFLRESWWDNAYVVLARMIWQVFTGRG